MSTNYELARVVENALPALSGSKVHYDNGRNMLCTTGYTSAAGNTYYQGIRLSDRLIITVSLGDGYNYTFMNGLRLYCFDGANQKLIGSRSYDRYTYSNLRAYSESEDILFNYLKSQSALMNAKVSDNQLRDFAREMVKEAMQNKFKAIS